MIKLTLIAAQSLDGFITRHAEAGTDFCSPADAEFFSSALKQFDSMIMGRRTFETLQGRILTSKSDRYLRKICAREPARFAAFHKPDLIEFTDAPPASIVAELNQRGRKNCVLLGGGETYTRFLEADLVDSIWLTLEPLVFGSGTPLVTRPMEKRFRLESIETLNADTLLAKYQR